MGRQGSDWPVTAAYAFVALLLMAGAIASFIRLF